ncbi:hypothetical protein ACFL16_03430 [Patescibacteria group bacterium]
MKSSTKKLISIFKSLVELFVVYMLLFGVFGDRYSPFIILLIAIVFVVLRRRAYEKKTVFEKYTPFELMKMDKKKRLKIAKEMGYKEKSETYKRRMFVVGTVFKYILMFIVVFTVIVFVWLFGWLMYTYRIGKI